MVHCFWLYSSNYVLRIFTLKVVCVEWRISEITPTPSKTNILERDFGCVKQNMAAIDQLGERQTEDLKVPGSIPGLGIFGKWWFWCRGVPFCCFVAGRGDIRPLANMGPLGLAILEIQNRPGHAPPDQTGWGEGWWSTTTTIIYHYFYNYLQLFTTSHYGPIGPCDFGNSKSPRARAGLDRGSAADHYSCPARGRASAILPITFSALHMGTDSVTEWLRGWTRNPLGSARRGSNPAVRI